MVVGVHDAQHSQAVSPLRVNGESFRSSGSIANRVRDTHGAIAECGDGHHGAQHEVRDYHSDYSDGLLADGGMVATPHVGDLHHRY
jgi:hypothetical protein